MERPIHEINEEWNIPLPPNGQSECELTDRSHTTENSAKFDFDKLVTEKPRKRGLASCNWVYLVLIASVGFATCNIIMANLAM